MTKETQLPNKKQQTAHTHSVQERTFKLLLTQIKQHKDVFERLKDK